MVEVFQDMFDYLLSHYALYMVITMGIVVSLTVVLVALIKKPIKLLTAKITNEKLRKLANKTFILFSFGLSALAWFVLSKISAQYFPFEVVNVFLTGALSVVTYALGDGIITKSQAKQAVELIEAVVEDEKVDQKDKTAVEEYLEIVSDESR